jgi:hypothetical protein
MNGEYLARQGTEAAAGHQCLPIVQGFCEKNCISGDQMSPLFPIFVHEALIRFAL